MPRRGQELQLDSQVLQKTCRSNNDNDNGNNNNNYTNY